MKMPKSPPDTMTILDKVRKVGTTFEKVLRVAAASSSPDQYLHWDKLQFYTPPEGLSHEEWWLALKLNRLPKQRHLSLQSDTGTPYSYALVDPIPETLHEIDQGAGGYIKMPDQRPSKADCEA
jgi:hypothetical protein